MSGDDRLVWLDLRQGYQMQIQALVAQRRHRPLTGVEQSTVRALRHQVAAIERHLHMATGPPVQRQA